LSSVGTGGSSWSSSSNYAGSLYVGRLVFWSASVGPLSGTYRADGLSVRCVQHLRLLFFFVGFSAVTRARSAHPSGPYPRRSRPIQ